MRAAGADETRPNLVAGCAARDDGPTLGYLLARRHRAGRPGGVVARPVVRRPRRRLRVGPRRAGHEVADGGRGRRRARWRARAGVRPRATADHRAWPTRRPAAPRARSGSPSTTPTRSAATTSLNEGGGGVFAYDGAALLRRVLRREGRLPLLADHRRRGRPRLDPPHGRQRPAQDGAAARAARRRQPASTSTGARGDAARSSAMALDGPAGARWSACASATRCLALLIEPMLGVTLDADADQRIGEDQRDPRAGRAAGRLPRARRGSARRTRARASDELLGDRTATSSSSPSMVVGNRSPVELAADGRDHALGRRAGPRRAADPDDAARLHRLALVPQRLPRLRRLRVLPPPPHDLLRAVAADPRGRRAYRRARPRARRRVLPRRSRAELLGG